MPASLTAKLLSHRIVDGVVAWAVIGLLTVAVASATYSWAERRGHSRLTDAAAHQLDLYAAGIESEFAKYESLPSILELNDTTFELLRRPDDQALRAAVNKTLLNLNVRAGSLSIVLIEAGGRVVAASDWYEPHTALDRGLPSAELFREAVSNGQTRWFMASGSRGTPECYLARPIVHRERVVGVVAVRLSLESIESTWIEYAAGTHSERVLVIDNNDVIIMASNAAWRYKTVAPLSPARLRAVQDSGQYPVALVQPLGLEVDRDLDFGSRLVRIPAVPGGPGGRGVDLQGYVSHEQPMARTGWRLMTLSSTAPARVDALHAALGAAALGALAGVLGLYVMLRRRALALQLASRVALQRSNDELERRVADRTAELSAANAALVKEVAERRRTEADLREAQGELLRAGRLAMLGRMSAAITHEINQPLTALRALSDNCRLLLEAGRTNALQRNMASIAALTERMGRITAQLKSFARSSPAPFSPVRLGLCIQNAMQLLRDRLAADAVEVVVDLPGALRVVCDSYRLEQVLVNLMSNALDAMKGRPLRRLSISAEAEGERVRVSVADTGGGLPPHVLERLFEPFFSTKAQGEGLGLGLVISSGIVKEFGGELAAHNSPEGAVFDFTLLLEVQAQQVEPV